MPCNSDHMMANEVEISMSRILNFINEIKTGEFNKEWHRGYHPDVYYKHVTKEQIDVAVSDLCKTMQGADPSKYSLELQMWWRDHKEADTVRIKKEIDRLAKEKDKKELIESLTPYEKGLLGLY